jgi:hypothetical protein
MFIFTRPLSAVLAGLAVALTIVTLDRLCQEPAATAPELVPRRETGLSSAPVRDLSLSCRLPPASFRELASESEKPNRSRPGGSVCAPCNRQITGMRSC